MTDESKERFLAERARALAIVVLTRRGDLAIQEAREADLDFLVSIVREDKPMRPTFGLALRATAARVEPGDVAGAVGSTTGRLGGARRFTFPVCLFFFAMRGDRAYFSWLAEPVVEGGAPKLVRHARAPGVELTDDVLARAVDRIVAWHDAVEAMLIA